MGGRLSRTASAGEAPYPLPWLHNHEVPYCFPRLALLHWTCGHVPVTFSLHEAPFPTLSSGNLLLIFQVPLHGFP